MIGLLAGFVLVSANPTISAHHAFTAVYDPQQTAVLTGVVTKFTWANPHASIHVDVKDSAGNMVSWVLEGDAPNRLSRSGWKKDTLKPGDVIAAEVWLPRKIAGAAETLDTTPRANAVKYAHATNVTVANGSKLVFGETK